MFEYGVEKCGMIFLRFFKVFLIMKKKKRVLEYEIRFNGVRF